MKTNKENEELITQEYLKSILVYSQETGNFIWKIRPANHIHIGDIAGSLHHTGYIVIQINKKLYLAHRLAWLYMTGNFPVNTIDHIDGINIPNFNKWSNLRDITHQKNNFNKGINKNNTSGYKGVSWNKRNNKWQVEIGVNGKSIYLGYFVDIEEASDAYEKAKLKYHNIIGEIN